MMTLGRYRVGPWQAEERPRFIERVAQAIEAPVEGDEVEQIAMFAGGGVGPFAGGAFAAVGTAQTHEEAAAGRVGDIADQPVTALAMAVGEVVAAHRLGITRETMSQICRG